MMNHTDNLFIYKASMINTIQYPLKWIH